MNIEDRLSRLRAALGAQGREQDLDTRPRDNVLYRIWENAVLDRKKTINEMDALERS